MNLRRLRRRVRRHPDLTRGAAQLFAEICDMHQESMGCIAGDKWFAKTLRTTPRTIRNWRKELRQVGVLKESTRGGQRQLIPQMPDAWNAPEEGGSGNQFPENQKSTSGKPETSFRKSASGRKEISGQPENSFRKEFSNTENINTSLREEHGGERARPRDGPASSDRPSADHPSSESDFDPVEHIEAQWSVQVGSIQADEIRHAVTAGDPAAEDRWRRVVKRFRRQGDTQRRKIAWALNDYENPRQHDQPDDADAGERAQSESAGGDFNRYAGLIER